MSNPVVKAITTVFGGNKSARDVKQAQPVVRQVNEEYEKLHGLSHDELRGHTQKFRAVIREHLTEVDAEIAAIKAEVESNSAMDILEKESRYDQIDKLVEKRDGQIEDVLMQILPQAFAVVRETCKRFKENTSVEVTATDLDKELAQKKDYIKIDGERATWQNNWIAAGNRITWDMVHYDVQLIGGLVLHQGKIAEMATGEGKTLVATLPAYLNGLAGEGVHIVTVNDYLAKRDSEWMGPIYEFLGLRVDCIDKYEPHSEGRKNAYRADITYGTNNEYGFDYLRDNMVHSPNDLVTRKMHYAMVDEVDSVLIDDARTPLIISGPVPKGDEQEFHALKPRIQRLVDAQKRAVQGFLSEAKKLIAEGKTGDKEGGLALLRAHRGLPKFTQVIKFLSEEGNRSVMQKTEAYYLRDQQKEMPKADAELYFTIDEKNNQVDLTEKGIELITEAGEEKDFFVMPDVGAEIAEIERSATNDDDKRQRKDKLLQDFAIKSERLHSVVQLLKAYTLFERDVEYVVMDGKVKIVDEQTGRIMEGRRYSDGLHQAIEAKENVKVEAATQTFATVTLQNYFRMYHKLAGMTGTAETEAGEFWKIYELDVVVIPTNRPMVRKDYNDLLYKTKREKYNEIIKKIEELRTAGRPVLVGTTSVEVSELLSRMLKMRGIPHNVLNAKQHQREAEIVAEAGRAGQVTIATNMAGRGTDIKISPEVREAGGLAIIGTERHEARRIDRQLRGRSGRQGDPGDTQFYVSTEDDLMRIFGSERMARIMDRMGYKEGDVIQHSLMTKSIERAQKKVEENNFGIRKRLIEYDDVMNSQRSNVYKKRKHALLGERLSVDIQNTFADLAEDIVTTHRDLDDYEGFRIDCLRYLSIEPPFDADQFKHMGAAELSALVYQEAAAFYKRKTENLVKTTFPVIADVYKNRGSTIQYIAIPFTDGHRGINVRANLEQAYSTEGRSVITDFEKTITLALLDETWKEHLRAMDDLKQSVQAAVYEQKDPLLIYKFEAFELFKQMLIELNREITSFLFRGSIPIRTGDEVQQAREPVSAATGMRTGRADLPGRPPQLATSAGPQTRQKVVAENKVGRNDPCPCGSGKKYKKCHGATVST
jgi:preprotein translocase subunit SecA